MSSHALRVFEESAILVRRSEALAAPMDNETVMFNPVRGSYYAFGVVGTRVWELLEQPASVAEVHQALLAEFDVDAATCRHEVDAFLTQLHEADLIEVRS